MYTSEQWDKWTDRIKMLRKMIKLYNNDDSTSTKQFLITNKTKYESEEPPWPSLYILPLPP